MTKPQGMMASTDEEAQIIDKLTESVDNNLLINIIIQGRLG